MARDNVTSGILFVIGLVLAILGLIWFLYGLYQNIKTASITNWPKTTATVISSHSIPTNRMSSLNYKSPGDWQLMFMKSGTYVPAITYEYTISGRRYASNGVVYGGPSSYSYSDSQKIVNQNRRGESIYVRYNPSNPQESYIYYDNLRWLNMTLGALLFFFSLIFLFVLMKTKGSEEKEINKTITKTTTRTYNPANPYTTVPTSSSLFNQSSIFQTPMYAS